MRYRDRSFRDPVPNPGQVVVNELINDVTVDGLWRSIRIMSSSQGERTWYIEQLITMVIPGFTVRGQPQHCGDLDGHCDNQTNAVKCLVFF